MPESQLLLILAILIGVAGGLFAVGLDHAIDSVTDAGSWLAEHAFSSLGDYSIVLIPVLGGLIAGPLIHRGAIEAKGHGVPEVMEAVALKGGRIRGRVAGIKAVASAVTIGSGGSAGREGPIVQIGATLGSALARAFNMSEQRTRTLVAAGAASGIAAAFNAPLAGVFFALEVILQRFTTRGFAVVVLSSVTSSVVWRAFEGNAPIFKVPQYALENPVELVFYFSLGILAAMAAVAFVGILYWLEDRFEALPIPGELKPALGALPVGLMGVASVLVLGTGISGINSALHNQLALTTLALLIVGKIVATSFTLGSGASGGIFSPSLFIGAMLGALVGGLLERVAPGIVGPPAAYAMVGMAAVFAAAAQAPIASILILFEMTNDYRIMLPLMLACVTSTIVYSAIKKDSIYTVKLRRRGIDLEQGRDKHLLESIPVGRVFTRDLALLDRSATLEQAFALFEETNASYALVVEEGTRLFGVIRAEDISEAADGSELATLILRDVPSARVEDSLDACLRMIAPLDLRILAVVDEGGNLIGSASRDSMLRAYWNALAESERSSTPPAD